jgi:hypothetical protein
MFQVRTAPAYVSLTSGVAQYTLSEEVIAIHEVWYEPSAVINTHTRLDVQDLDYLRMFYPQWRNASGITPILCYTSGGAVGDVGVQTIGFYPTPTLGTSGTYPRVRLEATVRADITGTEAIPAGFLTDDLFLCGMALRWAERRDHERVGYWEDRYARYIGMMRVHVSRRLREARAPKYVPFIAGKQTRFI